MFAGKAEATSMFRRSNLHAARLDLEYMQADPGCQNPMDLLTDSGMASLGQIQLVECVVDYCNCSVHKLMVPLILP